MSRSQRRRSDGADRAHAPDAGQPPWGALLRGLREARGLTQEGFAAHLGYSYRSIRRWERGQAVPDAAAEAALIGFCREHALFRRFDSGPLAGFTVTAEWLRDRLAEARLGRHTRVDDPTDPTVVFLRALRTPPANLPTALTSFVGRRQERDAARQLLSRTRLLTVSGPGGIGKTRFAVWLAEQLASEYADGVCFVDLAPVTNPSFVAQTIAATLDVPDNNPEDLLAALHARLRSKRLLLLLDNFEHVLAAAPLVTDLLTACPGLTALVTSRAVLRVSGEQEFPLPTLAVPGTGKCQSVDELYGLDAVRLFVERAQAVRPDFALTTANADAVATICQRLEGIPLALELAAAWSRLLSPETIRSRLQNRLQLLTDGNRDLPSRQQKLRDTIAWSDALLPPAVRVLFRRLSVFVGGFTLAAAEAIADADGDLGTDVLTGLGTLSRHSLIGQENQPDGEPRFAMLETIREYAAEQLTDSGKRDPIGRRHAAYIVALAEQAASKLRGKESLHWMTNLRREQENIRTALRWTLLHDAEAALRLTAALWWFWNTRGAWREARAWLEQALRLPHAAHPSQARGRALLVLADFATHQGDLTAGRAYAQESLALLRAQPDEPGVAFALLVLGVERLMAEEPSAAQALLDESLTAFRRLGDVLGEAAVLGHLGDLMMRTGNAPAAGRWFEAAIVLLREHGDVWTLAARVADLGDVARLRGDDAWANDLYGESLSLFRIAGLEHGLPNLAHNLGYVALHQGERERAVSLFRRSIEIYDQDWGDQHGVAECLIGVACVATAARQPAVAARLFGAADAAFARLGRAIWPGNRPEYDRHVAMARDGLGMAAFQAAYTEGQAMPFEHAVAYAHSLEPL